MLSSLLYSQIPWTLFLTLGSPPHVPDVPVPPTPPVNPLPSLAPGQLFNS